MSFRACDRKLDFTQFRGSIDIHMDCMYLFQLFSLNTPDMNINYDVTI